MSQTKSFQHSFCLYTKWRNKCRIMTLYCSNPHIHYNHVSPLQYPVLRSLSSHVASTWIINSRLSLLQFKCSFFLCYNPLVFPTSTLILLKIMNNPLTSYVYFRDRCFMNHAISIIPKSPCLHISIQKTQYNESFPTVTIYPGHYNKKHLRTEVDVRHNLLAREQRNIAWLVVFRHFLKIGKLNILYFYMMTSKIDDISWNTVMGKTFKQRIYSLFRIFSFNDIFPPLSYLVLNENK